ncbi:MAG: SAM-dependent methyltransferase [Ruminococcaceae bacterium]|nr:SAM-dependent methyltransferase [Oscillospiraceae bacterium]
MNKFMTPRLVGIAACVSPGATVIDVGSDHGYVPIYLLKEKIATSALATDVHDGPLDRSRENIDRFGLSASIQTQKADGLVGVDVTDYDTVIIAGMGGMLIAEILQKAPDLAGKKLILQPMTAVVELRKFLLSSGFVITREKIVQEGEKLYAILEAARGEGEMYTPAELLVGRENRQDPLYPVWVERVKDKLKKRLSGLIAGKAMQKKEIEEVKRLLEVLGK